MNSSVNLIKILHNIALTLKEAFGTDESIQIRLH